MGSRTPGPCLPAPPRTDGCPAEVGVWGRPSGMTGRSCNPRLTGRTKNSGQRNRHPAASSGQSDSDTPSSYPSLVWGLKSPALRTASESQPPGVGSAFPLIPAGEPRSLARRVRCFLECLRPHIFWCRNLGSSTWLEARLTRVFVLVADCVHCCFIWDAALEMAISGPLANCWLPGCPLRGSWPVCPHQWDPRPRRTRTHTCSHTHAHSHRLLHTCTHTHMCTHRPLPSSSTAVRDWASGVSPGAGGWGHRPGADPGPPPPLSCLPPHLTRHLGQRRLLGVAAPVTAEGVTGAHVQCADQSQ